MFHLSLGPIFHEIFRPHPACNIRSVFPVLADRIRTGTPDPESESGGVIKKAVFPRLLPEEGKPTTRLSWLKS